MSKVKRVLGLAGILVLVLGLLFGCARLFWHDHAQSGWYIRLNVGDPGAKMIGVGEYDVTGLSIAVYDPGDQLLDAIEWDAVEGPKSYTVQVSQAGTHRIEVTHFSDDGGEVVEATESAEFEIQPMVITVIDITPGMVGLILIDGQGTEPELSDGTLTVHLSGVDAPDGTLVPVGVFEHGLDPMVDPMGLLAVGGNELMGGATETTMTLADSEGQILWIGTGGEYYDVYIWLDINNNLDEVQMPEPGIDRIYSVFPVVVQIDGDTHLYVNDGVFVDPSILY